MNLIRKIATFLAVVAGLIVLSATPADARPVIDPPSYAGPVTSAHFAGAHVQAAVR